MMCSYSMTAAKNDELRSFDTVVTIGNGILKEVGLDSSIIS